MSTENRLPGDSPRRKRNEKQGPVRVENSFFKNGINQIFEPAIANFQPFILDEMRTL